MKRACLVLVAAAALVLVSDSSASAQGFGRAGFGLGFGSTNIFDLFRTGRVPTPPYFALNPPVYYSYPVPRTYGYSPFYYPGDVRTPDLFAGSPEPVEIINPYVPSSTTQPAAEAEKTAEATPRPNAPVMIENPYFRASPEIYNVSH